MNTATRYFQPLGLTPRERERWSLGDFIDATLRGDAVTLARYREGHDRIVERTGAQPNTVGGMFLPVECFGRDLTAAAANSGGYLVGTSLVYADGLFAGTLLGRLPVTPMPGMVGDVAGGSGGSVTTGWLSTEATASPDAAMTFGQRAMRPKTVGATLTLSHQLHQQLGAAGRAFVERQANLALGQAIDVALVNGSGVAGEPHGLLLIAGTTAVSGSSLGWSGIRDLIEAVEGRSVGGLAFVAGTSTSKLLRSREKFTGAGPILDGGQIDGIPCIVSRAMPVDALLLAEWPRVLVPTWGGIEVAVTTTASASAFAAGKVSVRLLASLDVAAEQPSACAMSTSIT